MLVEFKMSNGLICAINPQRVIAVLGTQYPEICMDNSYRYNINKTFKEVIQKLNFELEKSCRM